MARRRCPHACALAAPAPKGFDCDRSHSSLRPGARAKGAADWQDHDRSAILSRQHRPANTRRATEDADGSAGTAHRGSLGRIEDRNCADAPVRIETGLLVHDAGSRPVLAIECEPLAELAAKPRDGIRPTIRIDRAAVTLCRGDEREAVEGHDCLSLIRRRGKAAPVTRAVRRGVPKSVGRSVVFWSWSL